MPHVWETFVLGIPNTTQSILVIMSPKHMFGRHIVFTLFLTIIIMSPKHYVLGDILFLLRFLLCPRPRSVRRGHIVFTPFLIFLIIIIIILIIILFSVNLMHELVRRCSRKWMAESI